MILLKKRCKVKTFKSKRCKERGNVKRSKVKKSIAKISNMKRPKVKTHPWRSKIFDGSNFVFRDDVIIDDQFRLQVNFFFFNWSDPQVIVTSEIVTTFQLRFFSAEKQKQNN